LPAPKPDPNEELFAPKPELLPNPELLPKLVFAKPGLLPKAVPAWPAGMPMPEPPMVRFLRLPMSWPLGPT
jgi:hypothetical protein